MRHGFSFGIFAAAVVAVQVVTALTGTDYFLTQLIMSGWYALVVIGLCLLMGYAGQISLGHAAFFAIGGYTAAVLTTMNLLPYKNVAIVKLLSAAGMTLAGTNSWGSAVLYLSPWISLLAAVMISAGTAYVIGIPVLRLKGHYLAMATLGFGTIIYRIVLGTPLFGGADGLSDVPPFGFFAGFAIDGNKSHRLTSYYFTMATVLAVMMMLVNLINSRAGRALRAIHGNEEAAQAAGVDTARYKLHLFVLSAVIAAVAGVFMTHYNGGIGPAEAGVMKSVRYVAIVAVGGMANLWGALVAGIVLNFLSLRGYFGSFDDAVFGAVLIFMMLFAPNGIVVKRKMKQ
jgi:branched-chain amino acid transport system permease protein